MISALLFSSCVLAGGPSVSYAAAGTYIGAKRTTPAAQNIVIATMPYTSGPAANKVFCLKNVGAGVASLVDCTTSNLNTLKQDPTYVFSYVPSSVPISGTTTDGITPYNTTLKSAYDGLCVNFQGINSLTVSMAPCTATINGLSPWFVDWNAPSTVALPSSSWSSSASPSSKVYAAPWVNPPNVVNGWNINYSNRYCFQKSSAADIFAGPLNKLAAIQVEKCDSTPAERQAWLSYAVTAPTTADILVNQGDSAHRHINSAIFNSDTNLRTGSDVMSCEAMNSNVTVLRGNLDFTKGADFKNPFNQNDAFTEDKYPRIRNLTVPAGNWATSFFLDLQSSFITLSTSSLPADTFKNGLSNIYEFRASCLAPYQNSIVSSMNVNENTELVFLMSNLGNQTESFNTGIRLKTIKYTNLGYNLTSNNRRFVIEITTKIEKLSTGVKVTIAVPGVSTLTAKTKIFFSNSPSKIMYAKNTGFISWASPTWCQPYPTIAPTISQLTITPL